MESEECESDDPVEFLEHDDCSGAAYTELYFQLASFDLLDQLTTAGPWERDRGPQRRDE
jgi:hypothetical protein